jgi:hypothetical protein
VVQTDRRTDPDYLTRLLGALPAGAFVIDAMGTISFATERAAAVVDARPEDLVGQSVLQFVSEETAWMYASAVAMASDYPDVTMGPMRITLISTTGRTTRADLWATNYMDDPAVNGIVCLVTDETAAVWLGEAVDALAGGEAFSAVADRVVTAMRGHPVVADGVLLTPGPDEQAPLADVGLPDDLLPTFDGSPWQTAAITGMRQLHPDLSSLPREIRGAAEQAGYAALWVEPVMSDGVALPLALVLWRRRPGNPSPNQLSSVHQAAGILALAWNAR